MSAPLKASFWSLFCSVLQSFISLVTTPIFTHQMSMDEYGIYTQYNSWLAVMTILVTLNLSSETYMKQITAMENREKEITSSMLGLNITLVVAYTFLYLIAPGPALRLLKLPGILVHMMLVHLLVSPPLDYWKNLERCHYRYRMTTIVSIVVAVACNLLSIYAVYHFEDRVTAKIGADLLVRVITGVILIVILIKDGKKLFDRSVWIYSLKYSIPLIPHYLSNILLNQSDRLMIGRMVGDSAAAKYGIAYMISSMVLLAVTATNSSFVPYTFQKLTNGETEPIRKNSPLLLTGIAFLCLIASSLSPELLRIAGKDYVDAFYVIPPVAISVFFIFLFTLFTNIEYFYKKTKQIGLATALAAILNIVLNYLLIPRYGYYAAGYTTLISYLFLCLFHYISYRALLREENLPAIYNMHFVLVLSIVMLIMTAVLAVLLEHTLVRYAFILVLCMGSAFLYLRFTRRTNQ